MMPFLDIVTVVCVGLLTGTEFTVSVFINPVLQKLEEGAQARAISLFAARLGRAMPFWYASSLLLLILEATIRRRERGLVLIIAAAVIWAAVILLTVLFLMPINNRMMRLDSGSFPEGARREHERWNRLHSLRVMVLVVALVCFLLAILR